MQVAKVIQVYYNATREKKQKQKKTYVDLVGYPRTPRPQHALGKLINKWTTCLGKPKGPELAPHRLHLHPLCGAARAAPQTDGIPVLMPCDCKFNRSNNLQHPNNPQHPTSRSQILRCRNKFMNYLTMIKLWRLKIILWSDEMSPKDELFWRNA